VNGFHDTANAVAAVIYTHSLEPHIAVIWSGGLDAHSARVHGAGRLSVLGVPQRLLRADAQLHLAIREGGASNAALRLQQGR